MSQYLRNFFFISLLVFSFYGCKNDDSEVVIIDPTAENKKGLGASAEDLLSDDIYNSITIEFVYSPSSKPTEESINAFRNFLESRIHKPEGIFFVETQIQDQPGAPFDLDDIKNFEEEFRTQYTDGDNIAVCIYFSNGASSNDTETNVTLGTAYRNTSIVIYESTLRLLTSAEPENLPLLEQTTMQHEMGHIFGLVNIVNDDIHADHEDPSATKHCIVDDCLMYFEATNFLRSEITRFLTRQMVPQFDPLCIEDLQVKGGK